METLKELIKILNRRKIAAIDVLDKTFLTKDESNIYVKLYNAIESGVVNTDTEAEQLIYGKPNNVAYRQLKSRFKKRFLKTLLLLDPEAYFKNNKTAKSYYECISVANSIEVMIRLSGTNKTAIEIIKMEYPKLLEFKFYDILLKYSYYLIKFYTLNGDIKKVEEETEKHAFYLKMINIENECKVLYDKIQVKFIAGRPINDELVNELKESIDEISKRIEFIENSEITYNLFNLQLNYEECTGDVISMMSVIKRMEVFFAAHPQLNNNARKLLILLYKLKASLHLKDFAMGISLLNSEKNYFPINNSYNWFALKEFEFKLYLHSNAIEQAYQVLKEVEQNKFLRRQNELLQEKWKIFYAYLVFMDNYLNKGTYKFSLGKFSNEVPFTSKDKTGFNYAIRLIEILFLMARKDYEYIFKKMDGLSVYKNRYLNDNTYRRNHLFLNVLLKAEKTGFVSSEMKKLQAREIEELRKYNTYIIAEWEIIPYEVIWGIMIELAKS